MPSPEFWGPDEVLVVAPTRNYTVRDYKQLFHDINYETGWHTVLCDYLRSSEFFCFVYYREQFLFKSLKTIYFKFRNIVALYKMRP